MRCGRVEPPRSSDADAGGFPKNCSSGFRSRSDKLDLLRNCRPQDDLHMKITVLPSTQNTNKDLF